MATGTCSTCGAAFVRTLSLRRYCGPSCKERSPIRRETRRRWRAADETRTKRAAYDAANREKFAALNAKYRAEHKTELASTRAHRLARGRGAIALAAASGCVDCGERDRDVLDFDHVRGAKLFNIAQGPNVNFDRLLAELAKCEVRCANCHRRATAARRRARVVA